MISISCVDPENGKICEIHAKSFDSLVFKLERGKDGKKPTPDKHWIFLPDMKWYVVPEEQYLTLLEESEIEDTSLDLELEVEELPIFEKFENALSSACLSAVEIGEMENADKKKWGKIGKTLGKILDEISMKEEE